MNKFVKYGLIIGCVTIALGTAVTTAASALGANVKNIGTFVEQRFLGSFDFGSRHHYPDHVMTDAATMTAEVIEESLTSIQENMVKSALEETYAEFSSDDAEDFTATFPAVNRLEISLRRNAFVEIIPTDVPDTIVITSDNGSENRIFYEDRSRYNLLQLEAHEGEEYRIEIPNHWQFDQFEVENAGGAFIGSNIASHDTELHTAGGSIMFEQRTGQELEIESAGGSIEWLCLEASPSSIDVDNAGGDITLSFPADADEAGFGYDISCAGGEIFTPNLDFSGLDEYERRSTAGHPQLELETAGGQIVITTN